jgi:c(7)-type cytochrome triheme protein
VRRLGSVLAAIVLATALPCACWAVPPGFTIEFDGNGEGKVLFAGAQHTGPEMHCSNCHMEIFLVSRSAPITRADHKRRNFCFACHDGKTAFASRSNCDRCHAEPDVAPTDPVPVALPTSAATQ